LIGVVQEVGGEILPFDCAQGRLSLCSRFFPSAGLRTGVAPPLRMTGGAYRSAPVDEGEATGISQQLYEFLDGQTGIADDLAQGTLGDGPGGMQGDDGPTTVGMTIGDMTARLPDPLKPNGLQDADGLAAPDGRQLVGHYMATLINSGVGTGSPTAKRDSMHSRNASFMFSRASS